ncbi:hypothetical protein FNV43_RR20006 [Rhamnella rubrinervis]|uniref:Uncharacterized protein n=1 Tax=Rhamnella rubrinervis TaxID=2594499 RepID=A0A8K0DZJ6_9ROSA|nr:hypothetical protein FNV43_RR20006 [Rhamnella rubrinervis]
MTNWNSKGALEWEWEKVASLSPTVNILKQGQPSSHDIEGDNGSIYSSGGVGFSSLDLGHAASSKSSFSASADSLLEKGVNTPGEPTIGLKLGKRTYFEEFCVANSTKIPSISVVPKSFVTPTKRSRASYQSRQTPCCEVEGCNLNLKLANCRHRIFEIHSKGPKKVRVDERMLLGGTSAARLFEAELANHPIQPKDGSDRQFRLKGMSMGHCECVVGTLKHIEEKKWD